MYCYNFKLGVGWTIVFLCLLSFNSLSWSQTVLFNKKINSDATSQIHNEEQIIINPTNPDNVVAIWRDFREGFRQVGAGYSTNGGENWTDTLIGFGVNPYEWESDPGLTVDRFGNFYAVTLCFNSSPEESTRSICLYKSTDGGQTWGLPKLVVNGLAAEDKELMTCDQTGGTYDGNLYVSWTRPAAGFRKSGIWFSSSTDGGVNWSTPKKISADDIFNQWSVPTVGANGEIYVGWVQYSPNAIMFSKSTDGGNSFATPETLMPVDTALFFINGFIGVFSYPALIADVSNSTYRGNLYALFMDKTPAGDEDIFFSRSTDQGLTWSNALRINDDPPGNGADQFHQWMTVNQDGVISVIFYDRRNDPANLAFDVYMTQSYDGGQNFTANKKITTAPSLPLAMLSAGLVKSAVPPHSAGIPDRHRGSVLAGIIGEYIGISSYGSQNNLIWTDTREGHQKIYTAKVITKLLIPKLITPQNLSYVTDITPLFSWKEFSYYDTASYYKLQYSLDKNFSTGVQTFESLTDATFVLPDSLALPDTTYYWRVQSFNSSGDSSGYQDEPFVFTLDTDAPDIPGLISPADTTNDSTPLFTWNTVTSSNKVKNFKPQIASAPIRYTWQLATDFDFTLNLLEVANLSTNSYQLPNNQALDNGLTYYWRVRANDLAGNQSAFSLPLQFKYLAFIRGDANGDKARNLSDIIYLVNYVFKGGPPPIISLFAGDVNCNGSVNLTDVIFMVNYVFKGGSAPCA